jgi:hypothetical protein
MSEIPKWKREQIQKQREQIKAIIEQEHKRAVRAALDAWGAKR